MVEKLNMRSFKDKIVVNRESCVIKFYSMLCPLCVKLAPIYEEISNENNIKFYKIDVDEEPDFSKLLKFEGVPTLFLFHNNSYEEIPYPHDNPDPLTGYHKDDIVDFLKENVK